MPIRFAIHLNRNDSGLPYWVIRERATDDGSYIVWPSIFATVDDAYREIAQRITGTEPVLITAE